MDLVQFIDKLQLMHILSRGIVDFLYSRSKSELPNDSFAVRIGKKSLSFCHFCINDSILKRISVLFYPNYKIR